MNIVTHAPTQPFPHTVEDRFVMQTPRPRMLQLIQKALLRRDPVVLGATHFRFCKRGDQFQEGEEWLEAREHGLYQRYGVWLSGTPITSAPDRYTWLYAGDLGWFEEVVNPVLDALSEYERECAILQITFRQVMREMNEPSRATK